MTDLHVANADPNDKFVIPNINIGSRPTAGARCSISNHKTLKNYGDRRETSFLAHGAIVPGVIPIKPPIIYTVFILHIGQFAYVLVRENTQYIGVG